MFSPSLLGAANFILWRLNAGKSSVWKYSLSNGNIVETHSEKSPKGS